MRRICLAVLLALLLAAVLPAAADEEGVIVQSSCSIVKSGDYHLVYCYAQVHNQSEEIICLESGTFELHNGEQILATEDVTRIWPYFIAPGEDGYLFDIVSFEPDESGPVVPSVTGIDYNIRYMSIALEHAGQSLKADTQITVEPSGDVVVTCTLHNPTNMDAYDPTVAIGLYTAEGLLLYADGVTLQDVGVPAGGTVLRRFRIDDDIAGQWGAYGVTPSHAAVKATFRTDED